MNKAFINGKINTISNGYAEGFVINEDRIIYVGKNEDCIKLAHVLYDLEGKYVLPGFIDSHMHLINYGKYLKNVKLNDALSIEEIQKRLINKLYTENNTIELLYARGFNNNLFVDKRLPTKRDLDLVSEDIPIVIVRCCGHMCVLNSKAIAMYKGNNLGHHYNFDTGHFFEESMELILARLPKPSRQNYFDYIEEAQKKLLQNGIIAVGSDDFISLSKDYRKAYDILKFMSENDFLQIKISEQCQFHNIQDFKHFLARDLKTGDGNIYFRIGPLKIIQDGSLGSKTAKLSNNYPNSNNNGIEYHSYEELKEYVQLAYDHKMGVIIHTIGDAALDTVLKVYSEILDKHNMYKFGIVHAQITRADQLIKIIKLHLLLYIQSIFIDYDSKIIHELIDEKIIPYSYPTKSLFKYVNISNGSDCPVEDPNVFKGIQCALTRTSLDGKNSLNSHESINLEEALKTYTINAAIATNLNNDYGSIEEGKKADFIILSHDLSLINPQMIKDVKVEKTFINGKVVYDNLKFKKN